MHANKVKNYKLVRFTYFCIHCCFI